MHVGRHESKPSIPVPKRVTYAIAGGELAVGWLVNLSVVGVVVESASVPPMGTLLDLEIELAPGAPIAAQARVQWTKATSFGAQFLALGARETHAIVKAMKVHPE
jgi:hypothetical protein